MAAIRKINARQTTRRKPAPKKRNTARRVSPIKPGLTGARNWATAQVRAASYSRKSMIRLIASGLVLLLAILWMALWLGGFIPNIKAAGNKFTKTKLMSIGFVVEHVDVVGEGRISEAEVRARLGVQPGDYLFDMDIETAQERVQSLSWVDTAVIRRLWPNRVVVHINERRPFALWQSNEVIHLVDNNGVVITDAQLPNFSHLPLVIGGGAAENAPDLLQEIGKYENIAKDIKAIVYVGERRWDIVLEDGTRILLPEDRPHEALARLVTYDQEHGLLNLDIERIDMRVEGRLMLKPHGQERGRRA
ncbi:MAG: FtsQ-type POTRA domain-containing protein [Hyphomonadaceae bacterium]|nr:FtsQ-type POTRA domain-containing protein [Hyphomonadaceae bacterium]